jgi:hypothetical protein
MLQVWNTGSPENLLKCIGDALSFLGSIAIMDQTPGAVVLSGEHADLLREGGWDKGKIRRFVTERTGRTIRDLKLAGRIDAPLEAGDESKNHFAMDTPEDLMLICAGSRIGTLSMVIPGFSMEKKAGRSRPVLVESTV